MTKKSILNKESISFLEKYLNNAAPTGYEWDGQKMWMDYLVNQIPSSKSVVPTRELVEDLGHQSIEENMSRTI